MKEETMMFSGTGTGSFKVDVSKVSLGGGGGGSPLAREKKADKERKAAAAAVTPDASKAKKKLGGKKENPYASRGLDKFSTVLAELESQREKVLRRVDGDRVLVRFVQSESKGWVPIVVKLPPEELQAKNAKGGSKKKCCRSSTMPTAASSTSPPPESTSPRGLDVKHTAAAETAPPALKAAATAPATKKTAARMWSWGRKVIRPSEYWPFVSVLLLVSLVVFGRMFTICCTSIWWYLVPILSDSNGGQSLRRSMGKKTGKELTKKASDKKMNEKFAAAPLPPSHGKKISSGAHELISPRGQGKKR